MHSVASVCASVCVCVCPVCTLKLRPRKVNFGMQVHLQNIQVKFTCQGHRVKIKVTGAKKEIHVYTHKI